jgi:MFS family permease
MLASFAMLTVFSIASALSPNFAALVVFRWLVGVGGSCALAVVGGICADVYHDPQVRLHPVVGHTTTEVTSHFPI